MVGDVHNPDAAEEAAATEPTPPYFDQPGVHAIYRDWNRVLAEYPGDRMLVAEAWVEPAERLFHYVRPDEMQQAFNFDFLRAGWDAKRLSASITESLAQAGKVGAPGTWVLSNHDTVRHTTRFGLQDPTQLPKGVGAQDEQPDEALGLRRGRAGILTMLALPGSAYLYQGDELGLPEHTLLDDAVRQDPAFFRTEGVERGRDGCRVPMPWKADAPGFGFSTTDGGGGAAPWLPQPAGFAGYAADVQIGRPGSVHELVKSALAERSARLLGCGSLEWAPEHRPEDGVVAFVNGSVLVIANMGAEPTVLPDGVVVLASVEYAVSERTLQPDSAVWLAR
jgi:alpha-glucosidase